jgi:hypothetical protein
MGSGRYSTDVYDSTVGSTLRSGGDTFAHTTRTKSAPQEQWKVHDTLDPKTVAGPGSPFEGQIMRESRDSDEHPTSTPIAVIFDDGGDACAARVPLQLGQFESDNRMDEQLGSIFLEGNGGGGGHESYDLALYFMARHTATDSFDKRGEKGYLVMIGDEFPYDQVTAAHVRKHIGDELDENISIEAIIAEVLEKWNVTFIIPDGRHVDNRWRELLGPENVHVLDDMGEITKVIADRIGQAEAAKKNSTATAAP